MIFQHPEVTNGEENPLDSDSASSQPGFFFQEPAHTGGGPDVTLDVADGRCDVKDSLLFEWYVEMPSLRVGVGFGRVF